MGISDRRSFSTFHLLPLHITWKFRESVGLYLLSSITCHHFVTLGKAFVFLGSQFLPISRCQQSDMVRLHIVKCSECFDGDLLKSNGFDATAVTKGVHQCFTTPIVTLCTDRSPH
jgi:hypothetical protein